MRRFARSGAFHRRFWNRCCLAVLAAALWSAASASPHAKGDVVRMGVDQYWYYEGEVEPKPSGFGRCFSVPCVRVCDLYHCANGTGSYGTDGGQQYKGQFRHGLMHGHGKYESDYVNYVGGFADGSFDGDGVLDCYGPKNLEFTRFKGHFTAGFMDGPFEVSSRAMITGDDGNWADRQEGPVHVETFSHVPVGPFPHNPPYSRYTEYGVALCYK